MNYMKCVGIIYMSAIMVSFVGASDSPLKRCLAEPADNCVGKEVSPRNAKEVSPRDEQGSPLKRFLGRYVDSVDLRRAIHSSPRKSSSRDGIGEGSDSSSRNTSPRDAESPRSKLQRSKSTIVALAEKKDPISLRDVKEIEKAGSPRGELEVLTLLRATKLDDNYRRKSAPNVVDFQHSSPRPRSLVEGAQEKSKTNKEKVIEQPEDLWAQASEKEQEQLKLGLYQKCELSEKDKKRLEEKKERLEQLQFDNKSEE